MQLLNEDDGGSVYEKWRNKFHSNADEEEIIEKMNRDFSYYFSSAKWLSMIDNKVKRNDIKKKSSIKDNGWVLINTIESARLEVIKRIVLQDPIFVKIKEMAYLYENDIATLKNIVVYEIMDPRNPWRTGGGEILAEETARRRMQCAISWSKSLGILQDSRRFENWENKKSENKKSYQKLGK